MNANQLISLAELKDYLNWKQADTSKDAFFDSLIDAVSQMMEDFCCTKLRQCSVCELLSGEGTGFLVLSNRHVTSLSSLKIREEGEYKDCFSTPEELNGATGIAGRILYRRKGIFKEGVFNYEVTYVCGYAEVPADLKITAKEMCTVLYLNSLHGDGRLGMVSSHTGSVKMFFMDMLPVHRAVLLKYMSINV